MGSEFEVNTSGQYLKSVVPDEVRNRFNWGAFFWSWIWGIGNNTFITLLMFLTILLAKMPILNFIVSLALAVWFGMKGNEWAWRNKKFKSVEDFHKYQRKWVIAAGIFYGVPFGLAILGGIIAVIAGVALGTAR